MCSLSSVGHRFVITARPTASATSDGRSKEEKEKEEKRKIITTFSTTGRSTLHSTQSSHISLNRVKEMDVQLLLLLLLLLMWRSVGRSFGRAA